MADWTNIKNRDWNFLVEWIKEQRDWIKDLFEFKYEKDDKGRDEPSKLFLYLYIFVLFFNAVREKSEYIFDLACDSFKFKK